MPHYNTGKVTLGLVLGGLLLFGASINDPFHFDDTLIVNDSNVTNPDRWHHFFNPLHLRQLTFFSFYLNHLVGGVDPAGYHLVNVILHIANAVLLGYLVSRFVDSWVAVVAAAVFLAHPIQTESVLYIYQRSVLLAGFFSLLGLIAFHKKRVGLAAVLFVCAFESKESAVAVPIALAMLHRFRGRTWIAVGSAALAVGALALLLYWDETTVGLGLAAEISPIEYATAQLRVFYTYLRLLVWPYPQSLEYEFPAAPSLVMFVLQAVGIVGIAAIAIAVWRAERFRRYRLLGAMLLAFLFLLAPTSSIIPSRDVAFEHRLYLPMLAFSVFLAAVLARLPARTFIAIPLLVVCMGLTLSRGTVWSSEVTLWEDTVTKAPGKARAWFNLGGAHLKSNPIRARESFLKAIELEPLYPEAYYNLGVIDHDAGDFSRAIVHYQKAVEQLDSYWPAWNNMGNALSAMGQQERAITCLERTLGLNPDYWPAQYNLAVIHFTSGRLDRAIPRLKTVLDWSPEFREARHLLAVALTQSGNRTEAEIHWKELAESERQNPASPSLIPAPTGVVK